MPAILLHMSATFNNQLSAWLIAGLMLCAFGGCNKAELDQARARAAAAESANVNAIKRIEELEKSHKELLAKLDASAKEAAELRTSLTAADAKLAIFNEVLSRASSDAAKRAEAERRHVKLRPAMRALNALHAAIQTGVSYGRYSELIAQAKAEVDIAHQEVSDHFLQAAQFYITSHTVVSYIWQKQLLDQYQLYERDDSVVLDQVRSIFPEIWSRYKNETRSPTSYWEYTERSWDALLVKFKEPLGS
jgi:hypothetical protein